jgi:hypothetical protein
MQLTNREELRARRQAGSVPAAAARIATTEDQERPGGRWITAPQ